MPMPLDMLRYCVKETLDGLVYLHINDVVHEDLLVTLWFYFPIIYHYHYHLRVAGYCAINIILFLLDSLSC